MQQRVYQILKQHEVMMMEKYDNIEVRVNARMNILESENKRLSTMI